MKLDEYGLGPVSVHEWIRMRSSRGNYVVIKWHGQTVGDVFFSVDRAWVWTPVRAVSINQNHQIKWTPEKDTYGEFIEWATHVARGEWHWTNGSKKLATLEQ